MSGRDRGVERARAEILETAIVAAMTARPAGCMTYFIAYILRKERGFIVETAEVRRRLKAMERVGRVRCIASGPGCHSEWKMVS